MLVPLAVAAGIAAWPLLVLVLIIVAVAVVASRFAFGPSLARGRRPRKRHLVVRIVCGLLGALILVAVAAGTWQEVQRCYAAEEPGPALTVRVPTLPPPAPPATLKPSGNVEIEKARLHFTFVVAECEAGELRPVAVGQQEVRWPEDRGRHFRREFEVGHDSLSFGFDLHSLHWSTSSTGGAEQAAIMCSGSRQLQARDRRYRGGGRSSTSGDFEPDQLWRQGPTVFGSGIVGQKTPLSIAAGPGHARAICQFAWGACVAEGDPLKEVAAAELLRPHEAEVRQALVESGAAPGLRLASQGQEVPVRGLALAAHIGVSSLLLIVAAFLLSQLFARRSLAFAGVLAAIVLYVAALDRVVLGAHLAHLRDANARLGARVTACCRLTDTFFHRRTALGGARAVADDPQAPSALRDVAQEAARVLSAAP